MKKTRSISVLMLIVLLFSLLLSGCFDFNGAKTSAEVYCELFFKSDSKNLQKAGILDSDKDKIINEYKDKINDQLKNNFRLGGDSLSDDQLTLISDAYIDALSKITYEVKQTSKSGDEAQVEISTTSIDFRTINEQAIIAGFDATDNIDYKNTKLENSKFTEAYVNKLADGLKNADVSSEKSSKTFKFKKEKKHWVPDDEENFGYSLARLAFYKDNSDLNIDDESISPKESAELFWNLVIKHDGSAIEKLGYSKTLGDRIIKKIDGIYFKSFQGELKNSEFSLTDDQIQKIVDALNNAFSKNSAKFEEVSKTDKSAQVKVSATSINIESLYKKAMNTTTTQAISNRITDKQKIMEMYIENLTDELNKSEASSSTSEKTFSFTKSADLWLPADSENYTKSILDMCTK